MVPDSTMAERRGGVARRSCAITRRLRGGGDVGGGSDPVQVIGLGRVACGVFVRRHRRTHSLRWTGGGDGGRTGQKYGSIFVLRISTKIVETARDRPRSRRPGCVFIGCLGSVSTGRAASCTARRFTLPGDTARLAAVTETGFGNEATVPELLSLARDRGGNRRKPTGMKVESRELHNFR